MRQERARRRARAISASEAWAAYRQADQARLNAVQALRHANARGLFHETPRLRLQVEELTEVAETARVEWDAALAAANRRRAVA